MASNKLLPIFLIVAVDVLGLTIVIPLLPFYAEKFGASPFVVGLIVTSYSACQMLSGPLLGALSDRWGRRPVLLFSQIGTFLGFLTLAFAESLSMVFVARIIDGVTAGNLSIAQAAISDVTRPEERAKSFALIGIAFGLGFLFGPAISGFLAQYGYHYPIFASAGLSLTSIIATYFLLPRAPMVTKAAPASAIIHWKFFTHYFKDRKLAGLLIQFFLFSLAFGLFLSGFALFAERRFSYNGRPFGAREVGYVFAFSGLIGLIVQGGALGRLVSAFGEKKLSRAGFILSSLGYVLLASTYVPLLLFLPIIVSSIGQAILRPSLTSLISRSAGSDEQGTVLGVSQSLYALAQMTAPIIGGLFIEYGLLTQWALLPAVLTLTGLALSVRVSSPMQNSSETI